MGGCLLIVSNPFAERDKISMSNLEESRVLRVGWYQTVVLGNDEQVQTIPNAQFISHKISNRSRRTHRCMKQSVYLTHEALPVADALIAEVRAALLAMPAVDAKTRNFRVHLKALTQTALEIEIEVHFRGNDGTEYRQMRQEALLAVARAVQARGLSFAVLRSLLAEGGVDDDLGDDLGKVPRAIRVASAAEEAAER